MGYIYIDSSYQGASLGKTYSIRRKLERELGEKEAQLAELQRQMQGKEHNGTTDGGTQWWLLFGIYWTVTSEKLSATSP